MTDKIIKKITNIKSVKIITDKETKILKPETMLMYCTEKKEEKTRAAEIILGSTPKICFALFSLLSRLSKTIDINLLLRTIETFLKRDIEEIARFMQMPRKRVD